MKRDPATLDCFEVLGVEVKSLMDSSHSGNHGTSSSRAILTENGRNGSASTTTPAVFAKLQMQNGEMMGKIVGLVKNQGKTLADQGASMRTCVEALTAQAKTLTAQGKTLTAQGKTLTAQAKLLETHGEAIVQLMKGQQELQKDVARVENQVGRKFKEQDDKVKAKLVDQDRKLEKKLEKKLVDQDRKLEKKLEKKLVDQDRKLEKKLLDQERKLKAIQGRIDKLSKGPNPGKPCGNLPVRCSSRLGARRVQEAAVSAKSKYEQVQCSYCRKTLSSSYIRQHMKTCPVLRRGQEESG